MIDLIERLAKGLNQFYLASGQVGPNTWVEPLLKEAEEYQSPKVVVIVEGGCVQDYIADQPIRLMIVDYDNEEERGDDSTDRDYIILDSNPELVKEYEDGKEEESNG